MEWKAFELRFSDSQIKAIVTISTMTLIMKMTMMMTAPTMTMAYPDLSNIQRELQYNAFQYKRRPVGFVQ